jgi:hypothetical protein
MPAAGRLLDRNPRRTRSRHLQPALVDTPRRATSVYWHGRAPSQILARYTRAARVPQGEKGDPVLPPSHEQRSCLPRALILDHQA